MNLKFSLKHLNVNHHEKIYPLPPHDLDNPNHYNQFNAIPDPFARVFYYPIRALIHR